ncbi:uncharacterized protein LOC5518755 [Nematostella vectensis]|nr:uncharacterized protein LOC5518755 [Nematostella vectensis]
MPRAFLIKAKTRVPTQKKDRPSEDEPTSEHSAWDSYRQDFPVGGRVTSENFPVHVPEVVRKPDAYQEFKNKPKVSIETRDASQIYRPRVSSPPHDYQQVNNAELRTVYREKNKRALVDSSVSTEESATKKTRQELPKKNKVQNHEFEGSERRRGNFNSMQAELETRGFRNYTHGQRHYANERRDNERRERSKKPQGSADKEPHTQHRQHSFALLNGAESTNREKMSLSRRIDANNNGIEKNEGLDNVKIVEYHSISAPRRENLYNENNQHGHARTQPQVYREPTRTSTVAHSIPAPVASVPQPPPQPAQQPASHPSASSRQDEAKVVYVPVYPVAQGPNGVIYEPIPNATPIMAKDAVKYEPPQQQRQSPPQPSPTGAPPQRPHPPPQQPSPRPPMGVPHRGYEPPQPQQLAASPAPQHFLPRQQHPQGQVIVQQQPPYPPAHSGAVSYTMTRPVHPQYQQTQPNHQPQLIYTQPSPPASAPVTPQQYQPPRHAVPTSQPYQAVQRPFNGQYQQQQAYQAARSPPAPGQPQYHPAQQIQYQNPGNYRVHRGPPQRPPPLPSQPQLAEKPALQSPSYPQESASRLPTPHYSHSSHGQEPKFVYTSPPAEFASPVYRVPSKEGEKKDDHFHNGSHKSGSRKRKSSNPAHAVPQGQRHIQAVPSPPDSYSEQPSPVEAELRCSERLVGSPHQGRSPLNRSSLIITPPGSPNEENSMVTVMVRDQGIQACPRPGWEQPDSPHINQMNRPPSRNNSLQSESSEEGGSEDEDPDDWPTEKENMYTEDGTLVVHIPYSHSQRKMKGRRGNVRFTCRYCSKGFQWHSHLASHERTHTGEKPFKCPECQRAFCRADGLQCHMLVHNKKKMYKCNFCGKGFNDKIVLEKHIYSHTGVKPFKCEYCGRAFSDSLSIEKHLLVHTGTKPYKCQYCVRSFNDSQMLVRHIRSHTGEKPFKCKHCSMAFSKQSALIIHTRVHTGEKPYKCPHCTKSFSISGNLQRHILIHTGERPYKCSKCPKAFNNPSHLSRHISKLHAPQPHTKSPESYAYQEPIPEPYAPAPVMTQQ